MGFQRRKNASSESLQKANVSLCDCPQVVSGTNYAIEFTVIYDCIEEDVGIDSLTYAPLRSTVFVPLKDASFSTENEAFNGPVIKDIWFYEPPEVIAVSEATPEESSPEEEAPAPEEASPEASPSSTTDFLTPSDGSTGIGTTAAMLEFSSPAVNSSSPSPATNSTAATSPEPEPVVEIGFDVAAQNKSIIAG